MATVPYALHDQFFSYLYTSVCYNTYENILLLFLLFTTPRVDNGAKPVVRGPSLRNPLPLDRCAPIVFPAKPVAPSNRDEHRWCPPHNGSTRSHTADPVTRTRWEYSEKQSRRAVFVTPSGQVEHTSPSSQPSRSIARVSRPNTIVISHERRNITFSWYRLKVGECVWTASNRLKMYFLQLCCILLGKFLKLFHDGRPAIRTVREISVLRLVTLFCIRCSGRFIRSGRSSCFPANVDLAWIGNKKSNYVNELFVELHTCTCYFTFVLVYRSVYRRPRRVHSASKSHCWAVSSHIIMVKIQIKLHVKPKMFYLGN